MSVPTFLGPLVLDRKKDHFKYKIPKMAQHILSRDRDLEVSEFQNKTFQTAKYDNEQKTRTQLSKIHIFSGVGTFPAMI